jgi:hypothetical protein
MAAVHDILAAAHHIVGNTDLLTGGTTWARRDTSRHEDRATLLNRLMDSGRREAMGSMAHRPDDLAPARQVLADLLAMPRTGAGPARRQVAEQVGYSQVAVANAGSGHRVLAVREFNDRADTILRATA